MERQVKWVKKNGYSIVEFLMDKLDLFETSNYLSYIESKLSEGGYTDVIVDLRKSLLIDSSGIGTLIALQSRLQKHSKIMAVVSDNETILKVFTITKMYDFLNICTSLDEAVEYLKRKRKNG